MQYTIQVQHGDVAQLGERSVRIREVEGSIPFVSTSSTSEESATPIPFLYAPRILPPIADSLGLLHESDLTYAQSFVLFPKLSGKSLALNDII